MGIEAVVELADSGPLVCWPRSFVALRLPIVHGGGNPASLRRSPDEPLANLVRAGVGMSRTPPITAAALAVAFGLSPGAARALVRRTGPAEVAPALWAEVVAAIDPLLA